MVRRRIVGFEPPLKQAAKFEMVVNVKTAKAIGSSCRCHFSCAPRGLMGWAVAVRFATAQLQHCGGPVAQWLEPTAHNGLVGGSSPPGPTTHSLELGNFPLCAKRPRTGGLCRRCCGLCRDQFRRGGDFGRVVSGLEIRLPGNGDRCQAETRFE